MKCLETAPKDRYQNSKEILRDLELFNPEEKIGTLDRLRLRVTRRWRSWKRAAVFATLAFVFVAAGFMLRSRFLPRTGTAHAPMTVLIADFSNHTGDPIFDGALEPVVKVALEGAGFITAYDRTQMRFLGLKAISGRFDEQAARQIAAGQGLGMVISGSLDRQGAGNADHGVRHLAGGSSS